jgi:hypothetical protein
MSESVPSNSQIDFFAALEIPNESLNGGRKFLLPQAATWISIKAKFKTSGRNRREEIMKCQMGVECEANEGKVVIRQP